MDHSRGYIKENVQRIVKVFKWGVSEELVPSSRHAKLACVEGLRKGFTRAREDYQWCEILEYFGAATQIGMTATPKESRTSTTWASRSTFIC